jgi:hypothetical protein
MQVTLTGRRDELPNIEVDRFALRERAVNDNDGHNPAVLTYEERRRLFVLSGIPRRSPDEEVEYADLKARAEAIDQQEAGGGLKPETGA